MTITYFIDFETRSLADLKVIGAREYARSPDTEVLCLAIARNDGKPHVMVPAANNIPEFESGAIFVAHNASFEFYVWNEILTKRYGWPPLPLDWLHCTMAMAYAAGLPGSLDQAAAAAGVDQKKDPHGYRLMLQMCKPRNITDCPSLAGDCKKCVNTPHPGRHVEWWDDPEKHSALCRYCAQDVEAERALWNRLPKLSADERRIWLLDFKMNERGIAVDLDATKACLDLVTRETKRLDAEMRRVTEGEVKTCNSSVALRSWLKRCGISLSSVAKASAEEALATWDREPEVAEEEELGELASFQRGNAKRAIELRLEAARSSTGKLATILSAVSSDGRLRWLKQYHGATTGRWAGRKVQPDNFPRGTCRIPPEEQDRILSGLAADTITLEHLELYGPRLHVVSDCLRGLLVPAPGKAFTVCDLSSIEARVLPWLAGDRRTLDVFRGHGKIYEATAAGIYGVPIEAVTDEQRFVGKVATLSLGYGGGRRAFAKMARAYGVEIPEAKAEEIKCRWRDAHPEIVAYWARLEEAAIGTTRLAGQRTHVGPVQWQRSGSFLFCRLPSGRVISYPYPELEGVDTPWGGVKHALRYKTRNTMTRKWETVTTFGGKLAENITQAVSRCVLAGMLEDLEEEGLNPVMHVHDEAICETDGDQREQVQEIMSKSPAWAPDLPVACKAWTGTRYRK